MTIAEADTIILQAAGDNTLYSYERVGGFCYLFNQDFAKVASMLNYAYNTVKIYWYKVSDAFINKIKQILSKRKEKYYSYIMMNENNYLKVGFSCNPERRIKELNRDSNFGKNYKILYKWDFDNAEDGYEMEIWLHRYYKAKGYFQTGNDHFYGANFTEEDKKFLTLKVKEIKINSKKWLDNLKNL